MEKIIIYYSGSAEYNNIYNLVKKILERNGYNVIYTFSYIQTDRYYYDVKHPKFYTKVLDLCEELNTKYLLMIIDDIPDVDLLLMELKARPNLKTKIVFRFLLREINRSKARANSFKELMNMPQVKGLLGSMLGKNLKSFPENWIEPKEKKYELISNSLINKNISLLIEDKKDVKYRNGISQSDFIITFFGRIKYSKGIDLFIDSLEYIKDDKIKAIIVGELDIDYTLEREETIKNKNNILIFIPHFVSDDVMLNTFNISDVIVLPYRIAYINGYSAIMQQASMMKKPVIAPDFFPFNEVVNKFNLGVLFTPEDKKSLAEAIEFTKINYDHIMKNAKFEQFVSGLTSWEEIVKMSVN